MNDLGKLWKTIGEKHEIFRTKVFSVNSERFKCLRTGAEHDFITFGTCDWVNIVAVTPEHKVVMIRQFRHGSLKTEFEIPGGCIDRSDASPVDAGIRELAEETGYSGKNARIIGSVCPNPALQGNICYTVRIDDAVKTSEPSPEPTECIETIELKPAEIMDMIRSGELDHALVIDAVFFALLPRFENIMR